MTKINAIRYVALGLVGLWAGSTQAATYAIDASHTTIGFSVRHMVVANVKGTFDAFSGHIDFDPENLSEMKAAATIEVASVNTRDQRRDDHLRNEDFFDAPNHPQITFTTTRVEGELPNVTLIGDLTIRGVTKEISLPVEVNGPITDPWGNERIGLSGSTRINRQDFGVSWSNTLDGGGLVVGDVVTLLIEVEGIKQ
ncbi:MAG TPA: YceI family protein [Kiritimatiellia bacterium]|nr:YceI family protein [Kiritimatiellia bacterium]HMO99006.1 YceI family protein [Kiritimatiellia bacterium]HMP95893.1 YceI family protein [Kiritimatiellia bacterium]